jgi:hypothetical protein
MEQRRAQHEIETAFTEWKSEGFGGDSRRRGRPQVRGSAVAAKYALVATLFSIPVLNLRSSVSVSSAGSGR